MPFFSRGEEMSEPVPSAPQRIATKAQGIYDALDADLKTANEGQFMVIDVASEEHYIGESSEEAFRKARGAAPHGVFHLIRIGSEATYRTSFSTGHAAGNWHWRI